MADDLGHADCTRRRVGAVIDPKGTSSRDEPYDARLARERHYADQMSLYAYGSRGILNSMSSRPMAGPPGGRGSLFVDEAWYQWNPKDEGPFPVIDATHPENLYGTLGVDKCPGLPDAC